MLPSCTTKGIKCNPFLSGCYNPNRTICEWNESGMFMFYQPRLGFKMSLQWQLRGTWYLSCQGGRLCQIPSLSNPKLKKGFSPSPNLWRTHPDIKLRNFLHAKLCLSNIICTRFWDISRSSRFSLMKYWFVMLKMSLNSLNKRCMPRTSEL